MWGIALAVFVILNPPFAFADRIEQWLEAKTTLLPRVAGEGAYIR